MAGQLLDAKSQESIGSSRYFAREILITTRAAQSDGKRVLAMHLRIVISRYL
jgi:hypothetical protein